MTKCDKCYQNGSCYTARTHGEKNQEQICFGYKPICEYCVYSCEVNGQHKGTKYCKHFKTDVLKKDFCSYGE